MKPIKKIFHSYILTENDIRNIYQIVVSLLQQKVLNFSSLIEIKRKDRRRSYEDILTLNNLQELFNIDTKAWYIKELKITVHAKNRIREPQITIVFTNKAVTSIKYFFDGGDDTWKKLVSLSLEDEIKNIKQSRFLYLSCLLIMFASFIMLIIVDGLIVVSTISTNFLIFLLIISILGIISSLAYVYGTPQYNFLWGGNIQILENRKAQKSFWLIIVIVGLLINIVSTIIFPYIISPFTK